MRRINGCKFEIFRAKINNEMVNLVVIKRQRHFLKYRRFFAILDMHFEIGLAFLSFAERSFTKEIKKNHF